MLLGSLHAVWKLRRRELDKPVELRLDPVQLGVKRVVPLVHPGARRRALGNHKVGQVAVGHGSVTVEQPKPRDDGRENHDKPQLKRVNCTVLVCQIPKVIVRRKG